MSDQKPATLAEALVAFQAKVPAIPRTRTVSVKTKAGGTYTFAYAPKEVILDAIRKPAAECGLGIFQFLTSFLTRLAAKALLRCHVFARSSYTKAERGLNTTSNCRSERK